MKIRQAIKILNKFEANSPPLWAEIPDRVFRAEQRLNRYRRYMRKQRGQARYGPSPLQPFIAEYFRDLDYKAWVEEVIARLLQAFSLPKSILHSPQLDNQPEPRPGTCYHDVIAARKADLTMEQKIESLLAERSIQEQAEGRLQRSDLPQLDSRPPG